MKNIINLIVKKEDKGIRIDSYITKKKKELSRTRVKNLILNKKLKLNKKILDDPSKKINFGDEILLEITDPEKIPLLIFRGNLFLRYNVLNFTVFIFYNSK